MAGILIVIAFGFVVLFITFSVTSISTFYRVALPLTDVGRAWAGSWLVLFVITVLAAIYLVSYDWWVIFAGIVVLIVFLYTWFLATRWILQEQVFIESDRLMAQKEELVGGAQEAAKGAERGLEGLDVSLATFVSEVAALVPEELYKDSLDDLRSEIEQAKMEVLSVNKELSLMDERVAEEIEGLAGRLPSSFGDMTQQEIRRQLRRLGEKVDRLEDKEIGRRGIVLAQWQVWLAMAAILLPYAVALVIAILRGAGLIDADWELAR